MTLQELIEDFKQERQIIRKTYNGEDLNRAEKEAYGALAIKAEQIGGADAAEIIRLADTARSNIDTVESLRELLYESLSGVTDYNPDDIYDQMVDLRMPAYKLERYFDETEDDDDDSDSLEQTDEELEAEHKEELSEDCRKAYQQYLDIRSLYIETYGELPDMQGLI